MLFVQLLLLCAAAVAGPILSVSAVNSNYTYHDLYTILQSPTPNLDNQLALIDSLVKMVPSYVFNKVSINSTQDVDPSIASSVIPIQVNLMESLQQLKLAAQNHNYTSDAEWQQAVADVFVPLHDAHTRYNKPPPYRYASYQQPIVLSTRVNADGQTSSLYISPQSSLIPVYDQLYNVTSNITAYDGWRVDMIDGEDAIQHVWRFAKEKIGYTKDLTSRFNLAVNGYGDGKGYWAIRQQQAMGAPHHENVTYTLIHPITQQRDNLTLNWIGVSASPLKHPAPQSYVTELESIAEMSHVHVHGDRNDFVPSTGVSYQLWNDSITGILKIGTFNPVNYTQFIASIQSAIVEHQAVTLGKGRLLIDLRANGGGDICLGYATLRYIFPSLSDGTVWPAQYYVGDITGINGRYEMTHSDLFAKLAAAGYQIQSQTPQNQTVCGIDPEKVGYTTPCAWYDPLTGEQYVDLSYLKGPTHIRGGSPQNYSRLIHEGCSAMWAQWTPPTHKGYTPDQVLLVSDGLCGSTCSVFSSFIQQHGLGKTVVLGAIQTEIPQQFWSFPGGEVEEIGYIRELASRYGLLNDPLLPADLPDNATFRFAIRQIYPWNEPRLLMPLEFVHVPAHFQLLYNFSYNDANAIYTRVIPLFGSCVDGVGDAQHPCQVGHGTGYFQCVNGVRNTSSCIISTCDDGYYLKEGTTCMACPAGTYRVANSSTSLSSCDPCQNMPIDDLSTSDRVSCSAVYTGIGHNSPNCPIAVECSESTRNAVVIGAASGIGSALVVGGIVFCVMNSKLKKAQGLDESLLGGQ